MTGAAPIRVLVADDSPSARAVLTAVVEAEGLEVVAEAVDGAHAVELTRLFQPAIVLMDIEMPRLDGFEATRRIMSEHPTPVVMVSGHFAPEQAHLVLQALRAGALGVASKPSGPPGTPGYAQHAARLGSLVKALADVKVVRRRGTPRQPRRTHHVVPHSGLGGRGLEAVGVAASTGGPAAVFRFLEHLPPTLDIPVLVVQHIAPGFIDGLAAWLAGATSLPVNVACDAEPLLGGHVYLAPDDRHLGVSDGKISLTAGPADGGFRPAANTLFTSLAEAYGATAAAVVLTGMGHDGVGGAWKLREAGGLVLAQDDTSVIFGMPRAVAAAGLAHLVGPVEELAGQIVRSAVPAALTAAVVA